MTETRIIAEPGLPLVEVTREFDAPPHLLFRAHVEPDLLVRWLGTDGLVMTVDHLDARHGGTWRYSHRDAGGNDYGFHGVYHGTPSPDHITQTFEFEGMPGHVSLETITFEERAGKTVLRLLAVFQSVEDRDGKLASGMESGIHESIRRLDALVATLVDNLAAVR
ncbi:MAG: SRPBCC family protein [Chloroflexia bacterium]|nr:SRPBCC family protein [Chloroflexia bacterium]